ncbi:Hypothetical protein GLP15_893 [Giardia lamblia P15]|uniref:Uncharacterized protein n=1 Tax=Giardia intestinalis (strain P15) TaxID=658858 RepID=E1EZI3_GIAIA|nr:Hypothetical protein GLP15_893 [Giardia lamblia P15]
MSANMSTGAGTLGRSLGVRLPGSKESRNELALSVGPTKSSERPLGLGPSVVSRTSQYKNLEEQYNILKSKYMSNVDRVAETVQLSNEYKQLEKKYANATRSASELAAENEALRGELSETRGALDTYKEKLAEVSAQPPPILDTDLSTNHLHSDHNLVTSASMSAAATVIPLAAPSYVSQEEYSEMLKSRTSPVSVVPSAPLEAFNVPVDSTTRVCEALDNLQKDNIELKTDIKETLLEVTGNLQTTMVDFRDLRSKCEDMRVVLNQRELHLRDLVHTLEDRDKEILRLQRAIEAAEKHRTHREEEIQRFTTECEEVAKHNEEVMKEKTALLSKLKGDNIDLKAELHIKATELTELKDKLTDAQSQISSHANENASLFARLTTVKNNAERLLLQRDEDVERLTNELNKIKEEHAQHIGQKDEVISRLTGDCERLRAELAHLATEKETELSRANAELATLRQTFTQSTRKKNEEATKLAQDIVENKLEAAQALEEKDRVITQLNARIAELELELKQRPLTKEYTTVDVAITQKQRPLSAFDSRKAHEDEASSMRFSKSVAGSSSNKLVVPIEYLVISKQ